MTYDIDSQFLRALILMQADPLADGVLCRLAIMRARYRAALNAGMCDLIQRAAEVQAAADRARDVAFLNSLVDGSADYFDGGLYERLEPLYSKYQNDPAMLAMFNNAATAYGDAVVAAAEWALAGLDALDAIDKAMGRERWE